MIVEERELLGGRQRPTALDGRPPKQQLQTEERFLARMGG